MRHGDWNDGWGNTWWPVMAILMLAFWGGVIWVVVTLVRSLGQLTHRPTPVPPTAAAARPTPKDILDERLARGELEPDDYRRRLDALTSPGSIRDSPAP